MPLDELRVLLLHPSTSARARNAVWAELVRRARDGDPAWVIGLAGIAMPGLRRAVGRPGRRLARRPALTCRPRS